MSNMATMIMEGASFLGSSMSTSELGRYGHADGAAIISMESAEALHEIFECEFYVPNTCTINAALEGASCVEESSHAAIMESAVKDAFTKIKEFFIKLKDKIVAFLKNVKRYLLGIFGNDVDWVTKYEKELKAIDSKDLKDYKIKMYTYTLDKVLNGDELTANATKLTQQVEQKVITIAHQTYNAVNGEDAEYAENQKEIYDKMYSDFIKDICGKSVEDDEVDKTLWSNCRNGADNESDKDDVTVSSNLNTFIAAVKNSKKDADAYDKMVTKTTKMYTDAIKLVDKAAKVADNRANDDNDNNAYKKKQPQVASILRMYSSTLSKMQTAKNKQVNASKSALVERNAAYKKALTGAFAYARKHKGGK